MSDNLPPLPNWLSLPPFCDDVIAYARAAIEADRVSRDVPAEWFALLAEARQYVYDEEGYCIEPDLAAAIEDVDAMLAAAPQPQPVQASQWQPISTAPKDMGAYLFLCNNVTLQGFRDATGVLCVCQEDGKPWRVMRRTPTHWMPLQPPPAEQAKEE